VNLNKASNAERKTTMESSRMKIVYVITERNGKSFWNRVGVAFVNHDGSLNVKLEAIPVNGEIHIRDYVPREENELATLRRSNGSNGQRGDVLTSEAG
jgi:hypothetical protein